MTIGLFGMDDIMCSGIATAHALHHVVAISSHGFLPDNQKPGSDSDHQKQSIYTIFISRALNLS